MRPARLFTVQRAFPTPEFAAGADLTFVSVSYFEICIVAWLKIAAFLWRESGRNFATRLHGTFGAQSTELSFWGEQWFRMFGQTSIRGLKIEDLRLHGVNLRTAD